MATTSIFHPYEVVQQSAGTLALQTKSSKRKLSLWVLRLVPLFSLLIGVIVVVVTKEPAVLAVFAAFALMELVIFSVLKMPVGMRMDAFGLTVDTLSLKGEKETYYLWQDIDHLRCRTIQTKNGKLLVYDAVLNTRKKVRFLSFSSQQSNMGDKARINEVLQQVSRKEVRGKMISCRRKRA